MLTISNVEVIMKEKLPVIGQKQNDFGEEGLKTWKSILTKHNKQRFDQIIDLYNEGVEFLEIVPDEVPSLEVINEKLLKLTNFQGIFVDGLEEGNSFYKLLSERKFPIGNFIRANEDLSYTPAPDIVHDLYGHLPFLIDQKYADFCQRLGQMTCEFMDREDLQRQFERFFWFTIEFALIKTPKGLRIFGAGIASSVGECDYALSGKPELVPFDVDAIRKQEFNIDEMQNKLFVLESTEQLYSSLDVLYAKVKQDR